MCSVSIELKTAPCGRSVLVSSRKIASIEPLMTIRKTALSVSATCASLLFVIGTGAFSSRYFMRANRPAQ